ncbi:hypothetical protein PACTADRAFT_34955 [Pachysolen tannophilus NRRL Y-2460]|uniref:ribonuclease H n=1 Tax=Pachysolen tannophilus NRRL Y-2460 TaxID=669874 RepID=A0A1E4TQX9_PACTA|nr:hypothetical protein PACTADRAFT_34955 [Pachysolen tannophilus NRRL Y-2460]
MAHANMNQDLKVFGGYSILYAERNLDPRSRYYFMNPYHQRITIQRAELLAVSKALENIIDDLYGKYSSNKKYAINTESSYVIGCLTRWYKQWEINGYINAKGNPVLNQRLIRSILTKLNVINAVYEKRGWRKLYFNKISIESRNFASNKSNTLARNGAIWAITKFDN